MVEVKAETDGTTEPAARQGAERAGLDRFEADLRVVSRHGPSASAGSLTATVVVAAGTPNIPSSSAEMIGFGGHVHFVACRLLESRGTATAGAR